MQKSESSQPSSSAPTVDSTEGYRPFKKLQASQIISRYDLYGTILKWLLPIAVVSIVFEVFFVLVKSPVDIYTLPNDVIIADIRVSRTDTNEIMVYARSKEKDMLLKSIDGGKEYTLVIETDAAVPGSKNADIATALDKFNNHLPEDNPFINGGGATF